MVDQVITPAQYMANLMALGFDATAVNTRSRTAMIKLERRLAAKAAAIAPPTLTAEERALANEYEQQMVVGIITTDDYRTALTRMPFSPEAIALKVLVAQLKSQRREFMAALKE